MPDPEKLMAYLTKLGFAAFALIIIDEFISQILSRMTVGGLILGCIVLFLASPVAYFILQSERPASEHPSRRGAERTPLLPSNEEQ